MRHVSRTRRVDLYWFVERINLDETISIKYIKTKNQIAGQIDKGAILNLMSIRNQI